MGFERSDEMPPGMSSVYDRVEQFRFSRPLKNIARDFSDAVLLAEILAQLVPAWVQLHNYPSCHRFQQKLSNWETLNRKVLTKLKCGISHKHQEDMVNSVSGAVELLLIQVKRATVNSPFLWVKHGSVTREDGESKSPRSQSSSSTCATQLIPYQRKQKQPRSELKLTKSSAHTNLHQQDSAATSFCKLLESMSDATDGFDDARNPKRRSQANTSSSQLKSQIQAITSRPLTPNYAKPTLSNKAMSRPSSVDAKSWLHQASPFVFKSKTDQVSNATLTVKSKVRQQAAKKLVLNEFQEDSFSYFQSSDTAVSLGDIEDQAQVAPVIRTLSSGERTLANETEFRPIQSNPPRSRHFYTEVLNRVTFTKAKLATPLSKTR